MVEKNKFEKCEKCSITNKEACLRAFGSVECGKILLDDLLIDKTVEPKEFDEYSYWEKQLKEKITQDEKEGCLLCGNNVSLFKIQRVHDGKMLCREKVIYLCSNCMSLQDSFQELYFSLTI